MSWVASHLDLIALVAYAAASVAGAVLPAEHPVGQWCRRIAADLRPRATPPAKEVK